MPLFNFFGRKPQEEVGGELGYFDHAKWWFSTFNQKERDYIERAYQPSRFQLEIGEEELEDRPLTKGVILETDQTAAGFLLGLGRFLYQPEDYHVLKRILGKAEEMARKENDVQQLYDIYESMIQMHYVNREAQPKALDEVIQACEKQIALAAQAAKQFKKENPGRPLPEHSGYSYLTTIRNRQGHMDETIRLAKQARKEGWQAPWNESWDTLLARYEKKRHNAR